MKLPNTQPINSPIPPINSASGPLTPDKSSQTEQTKANTPLTANNKTVTATALQQLNNTWAKVISSQSLSPEQVQRVNQQGMFNASAQNTQSHLLKIALLKLDTQQGLMSLLSEKSYPKGSQVLISQNSQGAWQLQLPAKRFSLTHLTAQFSSSQTAAKLPVQASSDNMHTHKLGPNDQNSLVKGLMLAQSPIQLPKSMLATGIPLTTEAVKDAINNSGQSLERNLSRLLAPQTPSSTLDKASALQPSDIVSRVKQAEQQINNWVKQLTDELKPSNTNKQANNTQHLASANGQANQANSLLLKSQITQDNKAPLLDTKTNNKAPILNLALHDTKSWLLQNQTTLIEKFTQQLMSNNSFIPNWANDGAFKNATELNQFFQILMMPKSVSTEKSPSLWPANLSVQSQLNQTLQTLMVQIPDADKHGPQAQLLRQILNISQSLMKLQHDQLHNRLGQQQFEQSSAVQMSLPYLHQNHVQWAEFEYKQTDSENEQKEKVTGWHLILRFAQDTDESFAIESQLKQNRVSITLWATEKNQLKRLNSELTIFKQKLNDAGFNIESISSKHGSPVKLQQPIQQSLVDVHT